MFFTSAINPIEDPLIEGDCGIGSCQQIYDFIDIAVAPDGTPYAAMVDGCYTPTIVCRGGTELGIGIVGRLVNGPSLTTPKPISHT